MQIYNEKLFFKYIGEPVRIKSMGLDIVAMAEGTLLATFKSIKELRKYFPHGTHKEIKEQC